MDTGRQPTATAKWPLERGAAQTLESQVGSAGIQNVAFNMLRVTWNPLKQGGLPTFSMRSPMRPEDRRHPQIFQTRQSFHSATISCARRTPSSRAYASRFTLTPIL